MGFIHHKGKVYQIIEWQKPEDTDYALGEVVVAVYPAAYFTAPILAMAQDNQKFVPLYYKWKSKSKQMPQPLYVMPMPAIGKSGFVVEAPEEIANVGDARDESVQ